MFHFKALRNILAVGGTFRQDDWEAPGLGYMGSYKNDAIDGSLEHCGLNSWPFIYHS